MNVKDLRDIIFFINAVLYSIIFLALLFVVLAVNRLASKYLDKTHTFMQDWVGPKMLLVQEKAEQVRQKTAGLPGQLEQ